MRKGIPLSHDVYFAGALKSTSARTRRWRSIRCRS